LGLAVTVVTKVGDDENGRFVVDELDRHGVDTRGVIHATDAHTPFSFVCVHRSGQRSFLHTVGTNGTLGRDEIDRRLVEETDLCLITGTMLMPRLDGQPTADLLQAARQAGTTTILDTSFADSAAPADWMAALAPCLPHLDYFVPSRAEAQACTGHEEPGRAAGALLDQGCQTVIIKRDEEGAYFRTADGGDGHVPAYAVPRVLDTTGAGDCWCAGFLAGLGQDLSLAESVRLGNAVAAYCVQAVGASNGIPALDEVRRFQAIRNS
jgi:sugar/nucleoside kinase (ribokinase family)